LFTVCIKYVVEVQILNENKFLAFWIKAGSLLCELGRNSETSVYQGFQKQFFISRFAKK